MIHAPDRWRATLIVGVALLAFITSEATPVRDAPPVLAGSPLHAEGPPAGHTGGFEQPTCLVCHSDFELNPSGGALGVEGVPGVYEPNRAYRVTVIMLGDDEMIRAGFQGAFRFAGGPNAGERAGRVQPIDPGVAVQFDVGASIEYVQHTAAGMEHIEDGLAHWSFRWSAPDSNDDIVFHVAGNSANGDDSPLGDLVFTSEARTTGSTR